METQGTKLHRGSKRGHPCPASELISCLFGSKSPAQTIQPGRPHFGRVGVSSFITEASRRTSQLIAKKDESYTAAWKELAIVVKGQNAQPEGTENRLWCPGNCRLLQGEEVGEQTSHPLCPLLCQGPHRGLEMIYAISL